MAALTLLGTGAALSDAHRENTYLVVRDSKSSFLVDCAGSPTQRLLKVGVSLDSLEQIVLTHHHPDHIYGLPVLLLDLWLAGRKNVLHLYGLDETLRAVRGMMKAFQWERWQAQGFFPVEFHRVPRKENATLFQSPQFSVVSTPGKHLLPSIAVRVQANGSGRSFTYSSDTMATQTVADLASGTDLFFHEATTVRRALPGHSSARQAGEQARKAGVKKLVLVHLPPDIGAKELESAAAAKFAGPIVVGRDFMEFQF